MARRKRRGEGEPCSLRDAIEQIQSGALVVNEPLAQTYLDDPDAQKVGAFVDVLTRPRSGQPLLPPSSCLPCLP